MKEYRITKYNPIFRNEEGHYLKDEWTDLSDVGRIIDGKVVTKNEYFITEKAYINAVLKMLEISNLEHLRIVSLENNHFSTRLQEATGLWYYEKDFEMVVLNEDKLVGKNELELIIKLILRGFIWCRLEINKLFYVHFGYDYYMFVGGSELSESLENEILNSGLFVETIPSPYYYTKHKWFLQRAIVNDIYVLDEVEIPFLNVETVKMYLGLSDEHPGDIHFELNEGNKGLLKDSYELDFNEFTYIINCEGEL